MKIYNVHESIRVRADCHQGKFSPLRFQRGDRKYLVTAIHTQWIDREGVFPQVHFAVEAAGDRGSAACEIHFSTKELSWYLDRVAIGG